MIKLPKISGGQLIILLVISRMFSMFTYKPTVYNISATAAAAAVLVSIFINFMIFLPTLSILKKYKGRNVSDCAYLSLGSAGKIYNFFVLIVCLFLSVECITQFDIFMTSTIYVDASPAFFIIPIIIAAIYICRLGIESMARMAGFIFSGLIITITIIIVAVSPEISTVWVEGAGRGDVTGFFEVLRENVFGATEIIPFMILASYTKQSYKKSIVWFCVITGVLFEVISFLTFTVLGNYRETVMYPFYTVAAAAEKALSERFNSAYVVLWVFMAVVKLCVYLLVSAKSFRSFFVFKNDTIPLFITAGAVLTASLVAAQRLSFVNGMYYFIISGIPVILLSLVFPAVIIAANKIKERRKNR